MANTCKSLCFENRIRHRCCECDYWGLSDPDYGIPSQTVPLVLDPVTGYVRPFSSTETIAFAKANFIGWSNDYVEPGKSCRVQVIKCAQVQLDLNTPVAVKLGTRLALTLEDVGGSDVVSNWIVTPTVVAADAMYRVVKECSCNDCTKEPCPPAIADAADVSLTAAPTRSAVRSVLAEFNVSWRSGT